MQHFIFSSELDPPSWAIHIIFKCLLCMIFMCVIRKNHTFSFNIGNTRTLSNSKSNLDNIFSYHVMCNILKIMLKIKSYKFYQFFRFFLEFFAHFLIKFSAELCKFTVFIKTCVHNFYVTKITKNQDFCRKFNENTFKFTRDQPLFSSFLQFSFSQI